MNGTKPNKHALLFGLVQISKKNNKKPTNYLLFTRIFFSLKPNHIDSLHT